VDDFATIVVANALCAENRETCVANCKRVDKMRHSPKKPGSAIRAKSAINASVGRARLGLVDSQEWGWQEPGKETTRFRRACQTLLKIGWPIRVTCQEGRF